MSNTRTDMIRFRWKFTDTTVTPKKYLEYQYSYYDHYSEPWVRSEWKPLPSIFDDVDISQDKDRVLVFHGILVFRSIWNNKAGTIYLQDLRERLLKLERTAT